MVKGVKCQTEKAKLSKNKNHSSFIIASLNKNEKNTTMATETTTPTHISDTAGGPVNNNSENSETNNNKNCPWQIGQKIEACDHVGNWYPAKILSIKDFQILVHFQRWSSRFDQWFDMDSTLIRLTKESLKGDNNSIKFSLNEHVLARWTDGHFYPAQVTKIFNDNISCLVLFLDGFRKKVKMNAIEKLPDDYTGLSMPVQPKSVSSLDPTNHNDFVCDICKKGFRKESLLLQHKKHYHNIVETSQHDGQASNASVSGAPNVPKTHSPIIKTESKDDIKIEIDKLKHKITVKAENSSSDELKDPFSTDVDSNTEPVVPLEPPVKKGKGKGKKSGSLQTTPVVPAKRGRLSEANMSHSTPAKMSAESSMNSSKYQYYYYDPKSANKKGKPNLILPFLDAKLLAEEHENDNINEVVKCVCTNREENDLMVQCELCLSWQHALCMGFDAESDVPSDGYFCPFCRNPKKPRESKKNSYQLNHWLKNAMAPSFSSSSFTPTPINNNTTENKTIKDEQFYLDNEFENNKMHFHPSSSHHFNNPNLFSNNANQGTATLVHDSSFHSNDPIANLNSQYNKNKRQLLSMATAAPTTNMSNSFNNNNLPPSSHLFASSMMDEGSIAKGKKSFILHDFTNHSSNNCADSNMAEDHINNLIDISLKSDFFNGNKIIDEDEAYSSQVKATNMLSSAVFDVLNNLHALNYKIQNHRDVAYVQIVDKQKLLKEHLELIESKIEKIEKEIELKESYAIQTSSSTLTAASPENFGINDVNGSGVINTSISNPLPLSSTSSIGQSNKSFASHLFELSHTSNDHLALNPSLFDNQTLSINMSNLPPASSSTALDLSSNQNYYNIPQKLLTSSSTSSADNNNHTVAMPDPTLASVGPKSEPSNEANALARLYLSNLQNNNSNDEQELIENRRPTMSHEYLPVNLTDAELKMELSGHFKDLNAAQQLIFSLP